jgi:hypothetical protein
MIILGNGNVGINSGAPTTKLDVVGTSGTTLKIVDGNQGNGKVLTSDANGVASWAAVGVGGGGTGQTSLTAGSILVGNGTSGITSLAAGASGNVIYGTSATSFNVGSPDTAGLVDKASAQTIAGAKTFSAGIVANGGITGPTTGYTISQAAAATAGITVATTANQPLTLDSGTGDVKFGSAAKGAAGLGTLKMNGGTSGTLTMLPNASTTSYTLTWPNAAATANGQVLSVTTAGVLSWTTPVTNPMTTLGDITYGGASGAITRLPGNTTAAKMFLGQTGTGAVSAAPAWTALSASDITSGTFNTARLGTGTASSSNYLRGDGTWAAAVPAPAGSDGQIQYNNGGAMGANANFVFDDTNTRLGIGTATPQLPLEVKGPTGIAVANFENKGGDHTYVQFSTGTASKQSTIIFQELGVNKWQMGKQTDQSFFLYDQAHTKSSMTIDTNGDMQLMPSGGKVAIGTTATPSANFQVVQSDNSTPLKGTNFTSALNDSTISISNTAAGGVSWFMDSTATASGYGGGKLIIGNGTAWGSQVNAIGIDSTGKMGIGTTGPAEKLEVNSGNLKVTTGQAYVAIQTPATGASLTIDANSGNSTVWDAGATANPTITINNMKAGGSYLVVVKGTGTGSVSFTCNNGAPGTNLPASYVPANGSRTAGTLNKTMYNIVSDGTNCLITWVSGF